MNAVFLLCVIFVTTNGQFSSNNGNSNASKNIGNEISLWLNVVLLLILVVLFVCSVQFSPKCRRRRKKLPHQIRLEKTSKEISQQRMQINMKPSSSFINNLYKTMQLQDDQYVNIEEDEEEEDEEVMDCDNLTDSKDSDDEICAAAATPTAAAAQTRSNIVEHGKLLINNLNHYIQIQYDEYRGTHHHLIQDMLGMDASNHPQQQYRHPSTQKDSDYEPV